MFAVCKRHYMQPEETEAEAALWNKCCFCLLKKEEEKKKMVMMKSRKTVNSNANPVDAQPSPPPPQPPGDEDAFHQKTRKPYFSYIQISFKVAFGLFYYALRTRQQWRSRHDDLFTRGGDERWRSLLCVGIMCPGLFQWCFNGMDLQHHTWVRQTCGAGGLGHVWGVEGLGYFLLWRREGRK
eukprot:scaffold1428_cov98-Cylindrotheca_fusiformis.AAC.2